MYSYVLVILKRLEGLLCLSLWLLCVASFCATLAHLGIQNPDPGYAPLVFEFLDS